MFLRYGTEKQTRGIAAYVVHYRLYDVTQKNFPSSTHHCWQRELPNLITCDMGYEKWGNLEQIFDLCMYTMEFSLISGNWENRQSETNLYVLEVYSNTQESQMFNKQIYSWTKLPLFSNPVTLQQI